MHYISGGVEYNMRMQGRRKLSRDNRARVPFAVVAVLILIFAVFSAAYLSIIQKEQREATIEKSETRQLESAADNTQSDLQEQAYFLATKAIYISTQVESNESKINVLFGKDFTSYINESYPKTTGDYEITVSNYSGSVLPKEVNTRDIVGSVKKDASNEIDMTVSGEYNETNKIAYYCIVGDLNCKVRNIKSGRTLEKPLKIEKTVWIPYPWLKSTFETYKVNSQGDSTDMGRMIKYILTTIAQYRVLQGYGMRAIEGVTSAHSHGTLDILQPTDVELALNTALTLEITRQYRSYDSDAIEAFDTNYDSENTEYDYQQPMLNLIQNWIGHDTIDAADIIALYVGIDGKELNISGIIAQSINAIVDQFILKYFDYFGLMPFIEAAYTAWQHLEQIGQDIMSWFTDNIINYGKTWNDIFGNWLEEIFKTEGGLEDSYYLLLLVRDRSGSVYNTYDGTVINSYPKENFSKSYDIYYRIRETNDANTWYNNGDTGHIYGNDHLGCQNNDNYESYYAAYGYSPTDADYIVYWNYTHPNAYGYPIYYSDSIVGYNYDKYKCEINFHMDDYEIPFTEKNIKGSDVWKDFYDNYYNKKEDNHIESIRETIKKISLKLAKDVLKPLGTQLDQYRYISNINPSDHTALLEQIKENVGNAIDTIINFYQNDPDGLKNLIITELNDLFNSHRALIGDLKNYLANKYDNFVSSDAVKNDVTDNVANTLASNSQYYTIYRSYIDTIKGSTTLSCDEAVNKDSSTLDISDSDALNIFKTGGAVSSEKLTTLKGDLKNGPVSAAYEKVKAREINTTANHHGVLIQVLDALDTPSGKISLQSRILDMFAGTGAAVCKSIGLVPLVGNFVKRVAENLTYGGGVVNTKYLLPINYNVPFEFWDGNYSTSPKTYERLHIEQSPDYLKNGTEHLAINLSEPFGVHYTDVSCISRRPFETQWDVTIKGKVNISATTESKIFLADGTHKPTQYNDTITINISLPVVVYSGWNLSGVNYIATNTFIEDIRELVTKFLNMIWDTLTAPVRWIIDGFMKIIDLFKDIVTKLVSYGMEVVKAIEQAVEYVIKLIQDFIKTIVNSVGGWLYDNVISKLVKNQAITISVFGLMFTITFDPPQDTPEDNLLNIRVATESENFKFDLKFVELSDQQQSQSGCQYDILADGIITIFGFTMSIKTDPFMVTQEHMVECSGEGNGWGIDIFIPEVETYDKAEYSLQQVPGVGALIDNIYIPILGIKVEVDVGVKIKYQPGETVEDVVKTSLTASFIETWNELNGTIAFTIDFVVEFVRTMMSKFIDKLLTAIENVVYEVSLFIDVAAKEITGSVGGGLRLAFVIEGGTALRNLIVWIINNIQTYINNIGHPNNPQTYPGLPQNVIENLFIRGELYFDVEMPDILEDVAGSTTSESTALVVSIAPNIPAFAALGGLDWGNWEVRFGVYVEDVPKAIAQPLFDTTAEHTDVWLVKATIYEL